MSLRFVVYAVAFVVVVGLPTLLFVLNRPAYRQTCASPKLPPRSGVGILHGF
jgi:hypothetical protein